MKTMDKKPYFQIPDDIITYNRTDISRLYPIRDARAHKGSCGHVLCIAGNESMCGAAYFNGAAAYEMGAGLVRIYTVEENRSTLQTLLPEAIIDTYSQYQPDKLTELLQWSDVVTIGSGIGKNILQEQILKFVILECEKPLIIDADGLNLLSEHMDWLTKRRGITIITPHMLELCRLLDCSYHQLESDRFHLIDTFIKRYNVVCVCKDAMTLVLQQGYAPYLNTSGNASMAKGGSGDVLTGIIAGILAQFEASKDKISESHILDHTFVSTSLGVYIHGVAGDFAKDKRGYYSVKARDLIEEIHNILKMIH